MNMQWNKLTGLLLLCFFSLSRVEAQVTGGQHAMEFLRLSNAPHVSALGGINVANPEKDIAFVLQNPSLMRPALHNMLSLNYNNYYAGTSFSNLQYGYHVPTINTSFALGVQYLNYGTFTQTDNLGNEFGSFQANEFALTLSGSRAYKERWRYGAALKYAHSGLYAASANAILADVGVTYYDTANFLDVGIVAKNMGFMATKFNSGKPAEPLPFDLQIGISKRFKHIPLRLLATVHHLYEWNIRYDNPADVENTTLFNNTDTNAKQKSYFADKLFRHFIFGAELALGKRLLVSAGYNHLHRGELAIKDKTGMAGFSFGLNVNLNKFQVSYARSYYHIAGAYNEFGLTMQLNKLFGVGKTGEKIHWNMNYPDWE